MADFASPDDARTVSPYPEIALPPNAHCPLALIEPTTVLATRNSNCVVVACWDHELLPVLAQTNLGFAAVVPATCAVTLAELVAVFDVFETTRPTSAPLELAAWVSTFEASVMVELVSW